MADTTPFYRHSRFTHDSIQFVFLALELNEITLGATCKGNKMWINIHSCIQKILQKAAPVMWSSPTSPRQSKHPRCFLNNGQQRHIKENSRLLTVSLSDLLKFSDGEFTPTQFNSAISLEDLRHQQEIFANERWLPPIPHTLLHIFCILLI